MDEKRLLFNAEAKKTKEIVEVIEYGRSLQWKLQGNDELVDEGVLVRGWANHHQFFKAFLEKKTQREAW